MVKEAAGATTIYHYDFDGNIIAEGRPDGTFLAEYVYVGRNRMAKIDAGDGALYSYLNNYLGTPLLMTDNQGKVVWEAEYKPFGEANLPIQIQQNNFRFAGQYFDQETGLHYNYHRYYDPATGRYLTPDPIGLRGGINLYTYANTNPVNFIDPFGLEYSRWNTTPYDIDYGGGSGGFAPPPASATQLYPEHKQTICIDGEEVEIVLGEIPFGPGSLVKVGTGSRGLLGKGFPTKLNRGGLPQPYDPSTGKYLPYAANSGLKMSPIGRFTAGFGQGWATAKGASGGTPVGTAGNIGYTIGSFIGNLF